MTELSIRSGAQKSDRNNEVVVLTSEFAVLCCLCEKYSRYAKVSRSSYSFADERDDNITRYCRLTFPACDWVKI